MEWKHRTTEAARDALSRFCTRKASVMTIPVDNERDADCILADVICERDVLLLQKYEAAAEYLRAEAKKILAGKASSSYRALEFAAHVLEIHASGSFAEKKEGV